MRSTRSVPLPIAGDGTVRRLLKRNLGALIGLALLAVAAAAAASLATWTADDPSLSHATDHDARNFLGVAGAMVSDIFMQFLGLAATVALLPPVVWAWRLVFAEPTRFNRIAFASWVVGTLSASIALATLPVTAGWALPTGLGGVSGDLLLRLPSSLIGTEPVGIAAAVIFLVFAALAVASVLHACGLAFRQYLDVRPKVRRSPPPAAALPDDLDEDEDDEEEDDDEEDESDEDGKSGRMALLLGAIGHLRLRLGGRARRLGSLALRAFDRDEPPPIGADGRVEPLFGDPTDDAVGWDEGDDEVDDEDDEDEDCLPAKRKRVTPPSPRPRAGKRVAREAQTSLLASTEFTLPPLHLLTEPKSADRKTQINIDALEQNARLLEGVLDDFGVRGEIINVRPGPVVTLYELEPAPGIKSARVIGLADDIARSMSAISCRVAVIPGKNAIGIELPNTRRETVYLRELLASSRSSACVSARRSAASR